MKIAGVRFRDNWKVYDFDANEVLVAVGDNVIVESDRGLGFAQVVRMRQAEERVLPSSPPEQPSAPQADDLEQEIEIDLSDASPDNVPPVRRQAVKKVLRKATEDDKAKEEKNKAREAEAFAAAQDMISERELPMKLIRVEYSFDSSRATFFFFSETRIDFRELVKDLAHKLKSRIEMRQIGVRDVARMIGGFGPCGRELCCSAFLKNFEPVSIRMAKKQEMVLNPAKISGVCGRLLCCLSYEYGMYDEIKKDVAGMREAALKDKKDEEERRIAEEKKEADERRVAEEKKRQEERRQQEQRQGKQREAGHRGGRPEKKQDQRQERKAQPQAEQPRAGRQPQPEKQRPPEQKVPQAQPDGEPSGKKKSKRRFWRRKKRGQQQGGNKPPQGPEQS